MELKQIDALSNEDDWQPRKRVKIYLDIVGVEALKHLICLEHHVSILHQSFNIFSGLQGQFMVSCEKSYI